MKLIYFNLMFSKSKKMDMLTDIEMQPIKKKRTKAAPLLAYYVEDP